MPSLIRRLVRGTSRRIKEARRDGRSFAIYESGIALLAQYDCDDRRVSVARIAKVAGVSVGAFYARYASKDQFIYFSTSDRFRAACNAARRELASGQWHRASAERTVRGIVKHIVTVMGQPKTAGLTRAAFKRAPQMTHILQPIQDYRKAVTECARELLGSHLRDRQSPRHIDAAIQIVFATVINAALEKSGPLRAGSETMIDALGDMTLRYLQFSGARAWHGDADEPEEADEPAPYPAGDPDEDEDENAVTVPKDHIAIYDPDLRTITGSIAI